MAFSYWLLALAIVLLVSHHSFCTQYLSTQLTDQNQQNTKVAYSIPRLPSRSFSEGRLAGDSRARASSE